MINDNNSGSFNTFVSESVSSYHSYTDADIEALSISVNELRNEVKQLIVVKVADLTQAPVDIVNAEVRRYIKKKYKLGHAPTEGEIKHAISKTKDMREAAEYLGISVWTLKRYCHTYQNFNTGGVPLWQPRRGSKAIKHIVEDSFTDTTSKSRKPAFKDESFFKFNQP